MNDTSTIRVKKSVKQDAQAILEEIGMDVTTAVNIYLKEIVRYGGIPFSLRVDVLNDETLEVIRKAERGEDLHGPFHSAAELMESLNADD